MGTKNNPGEFDCYAKLEPDEPFFVLRGKDPRAPELVRQWVERSSARDQYGDLQNGKKLAEALKCAIDMEMWQAKKREEANAKWRREHLESIRAGNEAARKANEMIAAAKARRSIRAKFAFAFLVGICMVVGLCKSGVL